MNLERVTSEEGRLILEMQTDINGTKSEISGLKSDFNGLKESILDIKELLREFKKGDRMSDGGQNSVNGEERKEERFRHGNKSVMGEEGELKPWIRRVELPTFEGADPSGWLARAEKFFEVQGVSSQERLQLAFISMEGSANSWFTFWRKNAKNYSWEEFSMALNRRFGGKERCSVFEKLAKPKQSGRVEEYIQECEGLVSQAPLTGEEQLLGYLFAGLQPQIRNQIRPHDPKEVMRAMEIALDVEVVFNEEKGGNNALRSMASFGRSGITGCTEVYRGNSGSMMSSVVNNARM